MMEMSRTLQAGSPAFPVFLGAGTLEAVSLAGQEGVNSLFEYALTVQTREALNLVAAGVDRWDLDAFLGSPVRCRIQLAGSGVSGLGGGVREINGLIARVEALGLHDDQRHRSFRLTLRPWLHEARLNSRCRIFQNLSVTEVLGEVLAAYPFEFEERLVESYVPRVLRAQYNETDFEFFCRLTEEHGINYWFEHADGRHTLVLADHMGAFREADTACRRVRFQAAGRRSDAEHLHRLVPAHQQAPGQLTVGDHDPLRSRLELVETVREPLPPRRPTSAQAMPMPVKETAAMRPGPSRPPGSTRSPVAAASRRPAGTSAPRTTPAKTAGSMPGCGWKPCAAMSGARRPPATCAAWCPGVPAGWIRRSTCRPARRS